jgi:cold shock protein
MDASHSITRPSIPARYRKITGLFLDFYKTRAIFLQCAPRSMPAKGVATIELKETRNMPSGTVKWFNTTKGYGFIAPEDGGKDVFVHISAVERSGLTGLADNQKLSYELQEGRDGRQMAADLRLL